MRHIAVIVHTQALILQLNKRLRAFQIPELVKQGIVLLLLESLNHRVQVSFAKMPWHTITLISDFDVDDLLSSLNSSSKLRVNALADQNDFNHS